jgi:DNA polymerase-1
VHTSFAQTVAATGRLSSVDPNLQNIPIRSALGREIRGAFVAPPGKLILSADYSQIELRIVAHLAHDPALIEAFTTGGDIHTQTAALMFHCAPDAVTSDMRRAAKAINFGVIYGMGEFALGKQLNIPRAEAKEFIAAYFARYRKVAQFLEHAVEVAKSGEAMRTLHGRKRPLPNIASSNHILRTEAERIAKNTPVQGTAADILKLAMVRLGATPLPGCAMVLTVHDELVFEVDEAIVEAAAAHILQTMQGVMSLAVPLTVEVGWGKNWRDAH